MKQTRVRAFPTSCALLLVAGALATTTGCYTYQPIEMARIVPGSTVRTQLSVAGMVRLEEFFPEARRTLIGEVVDAENGSITLLTRTQTATVNAGAPLALRQRIEVQTQEITGLEERVLDQAKTALMTVGLAVGAGALVLHFMRGGSRGRGTTQPPGDGGGDLSVFSIPLPFFSGGGSR